MSGITNYKKINANNVQFGKIQARGTFYFVATKYQGKPLTVETPALITPTGIQAEGARSFIDLEFDVATNPEHQVLYDMFKSIDDRCIDESIDNMDKWFKGDVDEQFIEEQFKSPITAGWGNEPSEMRVELVSENPEDIIDSDGNVISSRDVTSLSSVKVKLQLLGVWVSKGFLGCHWRALSLVANLDHESKGRRRASSPRRASPLPPVTTRQGRQAKTNNSRNSTPTRESSNQEDDKVARRARIKDMLARFKTDETLGEEKESTKDDSRRSDSEDYSDDDRYSDDDSRRSDSEDDRRRYSDDDSRKSDSEDDRRRYSDDDSRKSESEDDRRRYSDDDSRRSDSEDRRYSDDRYSKEDRRDSRDSYYKEY